MVQTNDLPQGIHVLAKPVGAVCNIKCDYCFYLEKLGLFKEREDFRMSEEVLSAYIEKYIAAQSTPIVEFVWHGGEPTLRGIEFYRKVVELQEPYRNQKEIRNAIQTNGMRLNDEWCEFFKANGFFVGISLDGPKHIHDLYRKGRNDESTFDDVMHGLRLLQKHEVEFNILACVGRETAYHPEEVYQFFKEIGARYIQFTPIVERVPDKSHDEHGFWLAGPAELEGEANSRVTPWTIEPGKYGDFLIAVFDQWIRNDVGEIFVMNFEWALNAWVGNSSPVCIFSRQCGRAVALEHDGSVYACDHYVYPEYKLGNILQDDLKHMVDSSQENGFGSHKETSLPQYCQKCEVKNACWGGCPKHRFAKTPSGEPGLHYLCPSYKKFFKYIRRYLHGMTQLMAHGFPVPLIMQAVENPLILPLRQD